MSLNLLVFNLNRHEGMFDHAMRTVLISRESAKLYEKMQETVSLVTRFWRGNPSSEDCVECVYRLCDLTHVVYEGKVAQLEPVRRGNALPTTSRSTERNAQSTQLSGIESSRVTNQERSSAR